MARIEILKEFNDFQKGFLVSLLMDRKNLIKLTPQEIQELDKEDFDKYVFEMNIITEMINTLTPQSYQL